MRVRGALCCLDQGRPCTNPCVVPAVAGSSLPISPKGATTNKYGTSEEKITFPLKLGTAVALLSLRIGSTSRHSRSVTTLRKGSVMLVLGRKTGETIMIRDDIEITVIRTRNGSVRIGVKAPQGVVVRRGEMVEWNEVKENEQAGCTSRL